MHGVGETPKFGKFVRPGVGCKPGRQSNLRQYSSLKILIVQLSPSGDPSGTHVPGILIHPVWPYMLLIQSWMGSLYEIGTYLSLRISIFAYIKPHQL
jgi:hypothetical protein